MTTPPLISAKPALLLLPNVLGECPHHQVFLPASVDRAVESIDGLIAESEKGGRRFLTRFQTKKLAHNIPIALLNEHTPEQDLDFLLEPIVKGERWGLVSDAGLPCLADPGSNLVALARKKGILVQAFVGPSSIVLALMESGFSGQHFTFHGYRAREQDVLKKQLQLLEKDSKQGYTQIFIETPYRNAKTLQTVIETLEDQTLFCAAWDLTLPSKGIVSQPIALWKKSPLPNLEKKNAIFLIAS